MKLLKRAASLVLATSLVAGVAACAPSADPILSADQSEILAKKNSTRAGEKKWTVMVHLSADNNLYPFGLEDINEMEAGLNSDDINVIVLFDGEKANDSAVYKIKKDAMNANIISDKIDNPIAKPGSEIDSGDKNIAKKFVEWAVEAYPAQHYAHFLWNHGGGAVMNAAGVPVKLKNGATHIVKPIKNAPKVPGYNTNNFNWDDNGSHMVTEDINHIYSGAVQKLGRKLDVLEFDECLMAHVEIAHEAKNVFDYLTASEKTEPGKGDPYQEMIGALSKNPSMGGADFAKMIVKEYAASYAGGSAGNSKITKSATDIAKSVSSLTPAIDAFGAAMAASAADKATLKNLRSKTASFENYDCGDIGHFAKMVSEASVSAPVKSAAAAVVAAAKESIIANVSTANPSAQGLMIYFPSSGSVKSQFARTQFGKDTKWGNFLSSFVKP